MTTFGVDFQRHLQDSTTEEENIPHIITSCIDEIDQRGKQSFRLGTSETRHLELPLISSFGHLTESENTVILFVCPPQFCISIVSSVSWDLQWSQEKSKTMLIQNWGWGGGGGQRKSIMVFCASANRVCARRRCWRTKTIKDICIKITFIPQRNIILCFGPPIWPPCTYFEFSRLD